MNEVEEHTLLDDVQAEAFKLYHYYRLYHADRGWVAVMIADYFRREGYYVSPGLR